MVDLIPLILTATMIVSVLHLRDLRRAKRDIEALNAFMDRLMEDVGGDS